MCDFKSRDKVIKKGDLGIPGLTLRVYSVVREPYQKYGQTMVDLVSLSNHNGLYSTMYPADQFEKLTEERVDWLRSFHAGQTPGRIGK